MSDYKPVPRKEPHDFDNCWFCQQQAEHESRLQMAITVLIVIATVGIIYGMMYALGLLR
jgi:hypothetical protein